MTFLGNTANFYGGHQVANPANVLTYISGKPIDTFRAPIGTISIDPNTAEVWMLVAAPAGLGVWVPLGGGTVALETLTGNTGGAVPPTAANIDVVGIGGISVTGNPGTSTLTISSTGSNPWEVVSVDTLMVVDTNYITSASMNITLTLPATAIVGNTIIVTSTSLFPIQFTIAQQAGAQIEIGDMNTTLGATGSITSTITGSAIALVCAYDSGSTFLWSSYSVTGNFTLV